MAPFPVRRVAVIGAGISGVNTAAHLLKEGLDVTVFERGREPGGVWVHDAELPLEPKYRGSKPSVAEFDFYDKPEDKDQHIVHSSPGAAYDTLKNNVPTELMETSLNKWKPNTEPFVNHRALKEYIQDTARVSGVLDKTLLDTRVTRLKKEGDVWHVETSTWDRAAKKATTKNWTFDAVVVASGHYHTPKTPETPGLAEWKDHWPSRIEHSKRYRNEKGFENQTVLIIGGSASATDIAAELSPVAKKIWQSTRGGLFDHPPAVIPENVSRIGPIASYDLPTTNGHANGHTNGHTLKHNEPIPATITLAPDEDGRVQILRDVDRVIVATGYQFTLPFLPELHQDSVRPEDADDRVLVTDGLQLHNLHKDIFYIADPTLSFVGVPFYTATFSLFEWQAIAVAAVLSGKTSLPSQAAQQAEYRQRVADKGYGKPFHSLWGKDIEYAEELMAWVNEGRAPADRKPSGYSQEWKDKKEALVKLSNRKNILYEANKLRPEEGGAAKLGKTGVTTEVRQFLGAAA